MKRFTRAGSAGFTMIELLAVLAIVLTLAAILFPAIENARARSLEAKSHQNVRCLGQALIRYDADRGHYSDAELVFDDSAAGRTIRQRWMNALAPYMGSDERALTDAQGGAGNTNGNDVNAGDRDQTASNKGFADPGAGGCGIGRNNSIRYTYCNGLGRDNDANGNGHIDSADGECVMDANEAFASGATDLGDGRSFSTLRASGGGAPHVDGPFAGYGPGFEIAGNAFRSEIAGPTLPKVLPLGSARANRLGT